MKMITAIRTDSACYKANSFIKPVGIVVHSTAANNKNLRRYVYAPDEVGVNIYKNWFGGPNSNDVMPHAVIGLDICGDIDVAQILPYDRECWCAGSGKRGSYNKLKDGTGYIQFEICEDDLTDLAYFNLAMRCAVDYCVSLIKQFDISLENVVSHKEASARGYASAHGDPDHWLKKFGKDMDWFREQVKKKLAEPTQTLYRVQLGAFSVRANAENFLKEVKEKGFADAFITENKK